MKRLIECEYCADQTSKNVTGSKFINNTIMNPYPGEHAIFKKGELIRHCICDSCSKELNPNDIAVAISFWSDHSGSGYYQWEDEFIKL